MKLLLTAFNILLQPLHIKACILSKIPGFDATLKSKFNQKGLRKKLLKPN